MPPWTRSAVTTATRVDELTIGLLDHRAPTLVAMTNLRSAVALTRTKIHLLRERTLDHAEASSDVAIEEENLRARLNVILFQVAALGAQTLSPRLFSGRFVGFHDVRAFFYDQIGRINACWLGEYRAMKRTRHRRASSSCELRSRTPIPPCRTSAMTWICRTFFAWA